MVNVDGSTWWRSSENIVSEKIAYFNEMTKRKCITYYSIGFKFIKNPPTSQGAFIIFNLHF